MPERVQLTSLLPNPVLDRLERLRLVARGGRADRSRGEHLSGKGGASTEFCDYRDYSAGDDTRFVDWNIFSRLHRPYVKQFHHEQERNVVLLVDASASMRFEGKLDLARQLAAAFGMMGLLGQERVSAYASHMRDAVPDRMPPGRGRGGLRRLFSFVESIDGQGDAPLERAVEMLLKYHRGKGVCVILSDFLTFGDLRRGFNALFASGLEPWGIQILGRQETDPDLSGDLRLVDTETQEMLDVSSVADLMSLYQEHRLAWQDELASLCQRREGRFLAVGSGESAESVLLDRLRRQGWIA